jgi:catechol 2,3-dioxygenase-like lactoylglutathione lyase family enzyme
VSGLFDHVGVSVSDRAASRRFYDTVLAPLGHRLTHQTEHFDEWEDFGTAQADAERPVTTGLHVAFVADSRDEVDAFWHAGIDAGYPSDGEPGPRPVYHEAYYGGFLLDPDGNSVEAVHHGRRRRGPNVVDHLWIRVRDVAQTRRFYAAIAPALGLRVRDGRDGRVHVEAADRSFALLEGTPTANLHIAFAARDDATVDAFHAAAVAAGYRDNGPPGERPQYHAGYYGAFVLDPDGTNVEAVHHNRP